MYIHVYRYIDVDYIKYSNKIQENNAIEHRAYGKVMSIIMYVTDFRLHNVYENGLKSVKNKCKNWKENSSCI
jgi:hypothetical protein